MHPFERFSDDAKKVLTLAQEEAQKSRHSYIGTEHLLLGILRCEALPSRVLANLGIEIDAVRATIEMVLGRSERLTTQQIILTSRVKKVIEIAFQEARRGGCNHVGSGHLLLALLIEGEGIAAHVLQDLGANLKAVEKEIRRLSKANAGSPEIARRSEPGTARRNWDRLQVGVRVLYHEPEPPHRLWEGVILSREATAGGLILDIRIPYRRRGASVQAVPADVHAVPVLDSQDCPLCGVTAGKG